MVIVMIVKTRVFELCNGRYKNLSELAQAMGISVSQIYRVRQGKRSINQKFLIGAIRAFPQYKFGDLFYFASEVPDVTKYTADKQVAKRSKKPIKVAQ
ncbi:hypothetical protein ES703_121351 [subsurface metagenome]